MAYRIEKDSMGTVKVPADKFWGAQTQRSLENFPIGTEKMPIEIIQAFAILKKAAALTNFELGVLDEVRAKAIIESCDAILSGALDGNFPLAVWQTGSGTQSNMNINEVIANKGNLFLELQHETIRLHANDHVNKGQSSNDTFPTAMHIAAILSLHNFVLPALEELRNAFAELSERYSSIVKIGRTHLQDATPLTLGQEISAWESMLFHCQQSIEKVEVPVLELALGGTAVGTGLNTHPAFAKKVADHISDLTGFPFVTAENKFHSLTSKDALVSLHGVLKALAADLM